jgi:RNA polymerase sigma factor (TIGR02999 family)
MLSSFFRSVARALGWGGRVALLVVLFPVVAAGVLLLLLYSWATWPLYRRWGQTPFDPAVWKDASVATMGGMSDVTRILSAIEQGDPHAAQELLPLVYDELRKLAAQKLAQEKPGQTIQATALVHEAYLRLVDVDQAQQWNSRGHFFAAAAEAMRRVLVERVRYKRSLKAGGDRRREELADIEVASAGPRLDVLALHEALTKLEQRDRRRAEPVKLRFFAGLIIARAARVQAFPNR